MSPAHWGKLFCLSSARRKRALISAGLFARGDDLRFLADLPSPAPPGGVIRDSLTTASSCAPDSHWPPMDRERDR